jgi:hypothetical protein
MIIYRYIYIILYIITLLCIFIYIYISLHIIILLSIFLYHCATSPAVSESIPGGVTLGIFSVATDGTMCPGATQPLKLSTRDFPWG